MTLRVKVLVCVVVAGGVASYFAAFGHPAQEWLHFFVYLAAVLLSSGMKVAMPKTEGTMSANFPFILLGILELSPLQAIALATCSVLAQCRIRVIKPFTFVQILFNVANVITATVLAWHTNAWLLQHNVEIVPALALAATVYFFLNTIPVALIIAWDSRLGAFTQWRQNYLWYLPFYLVGAVLAAAANLVGARFGWMTSLLLIPMVYTMYRAYNGQVEMVRDRERHLVETEALHLRTIEGLAMAIEAKDQNTHRHLMRVRTYVTELGKIMGLDESLMKALHTASFLHDIGKLAVPEHIINKPGKLTPEEFDKMKIHPVVGADILERVRFPYPVVPIVRSHHEAWDGSGYPDGLKGEEIPIGARILTTVDCFDALATERPYRKAMPLDEAMAFVRSKAGIQFDPEIVRLLDEHYLKLEEKARQQIGEMEPLKTDLIIHHGAGPLAGFEADQSGGEAIASGPGSSDSQATKEGSSLRGLSHGLCNSIGARQACSMMSERLQPFIPFDCFAVYLVSGDSILPHYLDGPAAQGFSTQPIPIGEGLSGWVAQNERSIVNANPTVEPNYVVESGLFTANSSALSIPLYDVEGIVFGVLTVYSSKRAAFSRAHLRILQAIQSKFSLSLQNAMRLRVADTISNVEGPTELPDLQRFLEEMGESLPELRGSRPS